MPNLEKIKTESRFNFNRRPDTLDREQLEYFENQSNKTLRSYFANGTILFAVVLGLASVTYMTVEKLRK